MPCVFSEKFWWSQLDIASPPHWFIYYAANFEIPKVCALLFLTYAMCHFGKIPGNSIKYGPPPQINCYIANFWNLQRSKPDFSFCFCVCYLCYVHFSIFLWSQLDMPPPPPDLYATTWISKFRKVRLQFHFILNLLLIQFVNSKKKPWGSPFDMAECAEYITKCN